MSSAKPPRSAFTIVELLVVIGVITVLLGILLPAVGGAQRRAKKAEELNRIRQVGVAFNVYANSNNDAALPGYLDDQGDPSVQDIWRVTYLLPDKKWVPPQDAATWPWRLLTYLEWDHETMLGYLGLTEANQFAMSDLVTTDTDGYTRPRRIAQNPAFGYNGFYVGGYWEMDEDSGRPRYRFSNAQPLNPDGTTRSAQTSVVVRSPSKIRDSSKMILFCSSSQEIPGGASSLPYLHRNTSDFQLGSALVVPPFLADVAQWSKKDAEGNVFGDGVIQIFAETLGYPIGRYTGQAATVHADLHTGTNQPGALDDQTYWINTADRVNYKHTN